VAAAALFLLASGCELAEEASAVAMVEEVGVGSFLLASSSWVVEAMKEGAEAYASPFPSFVVVKAVASELEVEEAFASCHQTEAPLVDEQPK